MSRQFKVVPSQSSMVFDCNIDVCFSITMTTTVDMAVMRFVIPGALYTFIFKQDANGGRGFTWPANCLNAMPIDTDPGAVTVQNFIGTDAGTLEVNIPGTWEAA